MTCVQAEPLSHRALVTPTQTPAVSLLGELRLFHGVVREAFQGPTHGRRWRGKTAYSGGRLPLCPIALRSAMAGVPLCPPRGQDKLCAQSSCFTLELSLSGPRHLLQGLGAARPTRACAPGGGEWECASRVRVTE